MTPTPKISIGLLAAVLSLVAAAQPAGQFRQPRLPEGADVDAIMQSLAL